MRTIPSEILDVRSSAEKRVHKFLRQIAFGPNDTALHSLNLAKHEYKRWGEADFVLLTRRGILLLEVKGGRVACRNGIWEFTDRFGHVSRKRESPASQAKSAFFSMLEHYLHPKYGKNIDRLTMGWSVVFDGVDRLVSSGASNLPEQPDDITAYRKDCLGHNSFRLFLERAYDYWDLRTKGRHELMADDLISDIASFLRPTFEKVPPLNSQLNDFSEELNSFTKEQSARMDEMQENDRIFITGGAGTGKTFLAVACARYEAARDRKVLVLTRSNYLSRFILSHKLPQNVHVQCLDEIRCTDFAERPWDTLVVDEGQDLCQFETLDLLDRLVVGGFEHGRWRWFGDPNNQVSGSFTYEAEAFEYLRELGFRRRLLENVRNAPPIVNCIHEFTEASIGKPRSRGLGSEVRFYKVAKTDEIPRMVVKIVSDWISDAQGVERCSIAVLLPDDGIIESMVKTINEKGIRAEALSGKSVSGKRRNSVIVSRAEDFKGLEKPLVCVAGLPASNNKTSYRKLVYGAFSRANHTLSVIGTSSQIEILNKARR